MDLEDIRINRGQEKWIKTNKNQKLNLMYDNTSCSLSKLKNYISN
jgi:hypothetical protein